MKLRLSHPLWVHLPALAALVGAIVYKVTRPGHISKPGDVIVMGVLGTLYICLSAVGDEIWARQEVRKSFNWLSLIDEALVGFVAATLIGGAGLWAIPVGAVALAIVLELLRPYHPNENRAVAEDASGLEREIGAMAVQGKTWTYWDVQNPLWMNLIIVVSVVWLAAPAIPTAKEVPWLAATMLALAVALAALYGGIHTTVTVDKVEVRFGAYRMLRMPVSEIAEVKLHTFSPLRQFGGYGIRRNLEMWAIFIRGNEGVLLTTVGGKKFLIGSDHPERLAAAVQAAMRYTK